MTIQWTQMNSAPLSTRSAPEAVAKEVKIKKFPDSSKTAYHQTLNKGQSLDPHDPHQFFHMNPWTTYRFMAAGKIMRFQKKNHNKFGVSPYPFQQTMQKFIMSALAKLSPDPASQLPAGTSQQVIFSSPSPLQCGVRSQTCA